MFLPIRTDVPLRSTPWMNWIIILLNVLIYALQGQMGLDRRWSLNPKHLELFNYVSYAFVHGSAAHLIGNMLFLYIFGNNINDRMGHFGYLGFYLAGAVVAGVAHVASDVHPVLGASGAIAAVTGAFLVLFPRARITIVYFFILVGVFELASMWFILARFVLDVLSNSSTPMGSESAVAFSAHIGGYLMGASVCLLMLATRLLPRNQWDLLALIDRWNRRRQYRDAVATGWDPYGVHPRGSRQVDPNQERIMDLRAGVAEAMAHSKFPEAMKLFMEMRAIDPTQVLGRQNQIDLANQLYEQGQYPAAADAYEGVVRVYPKSDQINHVMLMLGLLYARYLNRPDKAEPYLRQVIERLHEGREVELAKTELARITAFRSNQC